MKIAIVNLVIALCAKNISYSRHALDTYIDSNCLADTMLIEPETFKDAVERFKKVQGCWEQTDTESGFHDPQKYAKCLKKK